MAAVLGAGLWGGSFKALAEEAGNPQEASAAPDGDTGQETGQTEAAADADGGWVKSGDHWYWLNADGTAFRGWHQEDGRWYYLGSDGCMAVGWTKVGDSWYYFHEDGGMNLGELRLDNAVYQFEEDGSLKSAGWAENTGGGAYNAGCYDEDAQELFDLLNDEKKTQYFDKYPGRQEDSFDGSSHRQYDRYAGFQMDMKLNKAADYRLKHAMEKGYLADGTIPEDGTINDYLGHIRYRQNASCLEVYLPDCEDASEAFDKASAKLARKFTSKEDAKYSFLYYRYMGMSHLRDRNGEYFLIVFMR